MNISYITPYGDADRDLVHRVKAGDKAAIKEMAQAMAAKIHSGSYIVPMPSHTGFPGHTLMLAMEICRNSDNTVWTALTGTPRESQYKTKKAGGLLKGDDLGFRLTADMKDLLESAILKSRIVIVDDVIGTGETAKAALKLLPGASVLAYAIDKAVYQKHNPQNSNI